MHEVGQTLGAWKSFYLIIGTTAAVLTGLTFVVIALVRDEQRNMTVKDFAAFNAPTLVHYSCAFFTAALMLAPFRSFEPPAILVSLAGCAGLLCVMRFVLQRTRLKVSPSTGDDWVWLVGLPSAAYAMLVSGAMAMEAAITPALFAVVAAVTLLIFISTHNTWMWRRSRIGRNLNRRN